VHQHAQGKSGGWDPAMLDIAQDHALCHIAESGVFDLGLVFKGGTALRKCRSGASGRFSTDLDFAAPELDLVDLVLRALDGHSCHGFSFTLHSIDVAAGRANLLVDAPFARRPGGPTRVGIPSKVELSPRPCWLKPDLLPMLSNSTHVALGHTIPKLPVMAIEESVAEKLARYARVGLARDLYDLVWFGHRPFDEALVRRLWVQKVYGDVVVDRRWNQQFVPTRILDRRPVSAIDEESIGFLTQPADIPGWEGDFRARYAFLGRLDREDVRWAACAGKDRWEWENSIAVSWRAGAGVSTSETRND
jgi:predicted nucleotidyltransferase component of viral defense system